MNGRHERIERLAERWLEARATDAEEQELRMLLRTAEELPESLRDLAALFDGFEALAEERMPRNGESGREPVLRPGERVSRPLADCPGQPPEPTTAGRLPEPMLAGNPDGPTPLSARSRNARRLRLFWSVAVAAIVILGVFLGAELLRKPYCYIDGKPVYDKEVAMQATRYFDSFAVLDAPDRMVDQLIENN